MKKSIIIIFMLVLSLTACKDSFFDVNQPSNALLEDEVSVKDMLPYVEVKLAIMHFNLSYYTGRYSQHIMDTRYKTVDQHGRVALDGAWATLYLRIIYNLRVIEKKAKEQQLKHYLGIAQVLEAMAIQLATDHWGDVPFSKAGYGLDNPYPSLDTQEEIYPQLLNLLDEAIANLSATDQTDSPGYRDDVIYNGNLDKWIKAAHALKARIHLHLTKRNGPQEAQNVLDELQNSFTSFYDDMEVKFDPRYRNPWYTNVVAARRTSNSFIMFSEQLIGNMNGRILPLDTSFVDNDTLFIDIDPRLPLYAETSDGSSEYKGGINGTSGDAVGGGSANAILADNSYFKEDAPIFMLTYMETEFMKAEAYYMLGDKASAYQAYMNGIRASLEKLQIAPYYKELYLNARTVGLKGDPNQLDISNIMVQKYIALVLHPEIWTDLRRYDYDATIYPDFDFPVDRVTDIPEGEWPRRAVYPDAEVNRNPNIEQVTEYWSPLWWDQ